MSPLSKINTSRSPMLYGVVAATLVTLTAGGGVALAACCDLRVCGDSSRFAIPAAKLGVGYGFAGLQRLVDLIGPAFAKEMLFTARLFSAAEAYEMGLVNRVVPAGEVEAYVADYARAILSNYEELDEETVRVRVESRQRRREDVLYRNDPPDYLAVIDQSTLLREVGGPEVTGRQLLELVRTMRRPASWCVSSRSPEACRSPCSVRSRYSTSAMSRTPSCTARATSGTRSSRLPGRSSGTATCSNGSGRSPSTTRNRCVSSNSVPR